MVSSAYALGSQGSADNNGGAAVPEGGRSTDAASGIEELASVLFSEETLESILDRVVQVAVDLLDPIVAASVTLSGDQRYRTIAWSDEGALRVDEVQYTVGRGPCLEAVRTGEPTELDETAHAETWPETISAAHTEGWEGIVALPLIAGRSGTVGALNLYTKEAGALDELRFTANLFARYAAVLIANARAYDDASNLAGGLREAMTTREVIGVAKGILIERHGLGWDAAFDELRDRSQRTNEKLRDVAAAIVRERMGQDPPIL